MKPGPLHEVYSPVMVGALRTALTRFNRNIPGFVSAHSGYQYQYCAVSCVITYGSEFEYVCALTRFNRNIPGFASGCE